MNIAALAIRKRKITYLLSLLVFLTGIYSFTQLGRLEMPDFTIKTAVVVTQYPGASPDEVEREVTQVIEEALQSLGGIEELYSVSQKDVSIVYVDMLESTTSAELPQIWDELRRKIGDNQYKLPSGAGPSVVNDDFGDVYGLFYALSAKEDGRAGGTAREDAFDPSARNLRLFAKELKKELLLCKDVKKIEFWGIRQEVVYLESRDSKLTELGISIPMIVNILRSQNLIEPSGDVRVGPDYIQIRPEGDFTTVDDIADLLIPGENGSTLRLGDLIDIRRGYADPPAQIMRVNGREAVGLGISTVAGGNAVVMAEDVGRRIEELKASGFFPETVDISTLSNQGERVTVSLNNFLVNLIEAVVIVIALLMLFMGWQSGLIIGGILLLTVFATFIFMDFCGITMQIVSLGALILSLGMLVDNAIVIAEGVIIGVQRGKTREEAAVETVSRTQFPLLGATVIAILAFAGVGFAPGNVGEICRSLFWVIMSSLLFSWLFAVTTTPLLCVDLLHIPALSGGSPYQSPVFNRYRRFLQAVLRHRTFAVLLILALLAVSAAALKLFVSDSFFPPANRNQFFVDLWEPQGSHIETTSADLEKLEGFLWDLGAEIDREPKERPSLMVRFNRLMARLVSGGKSRQTDDPRAVQQTARFVGSSTLRFYLTNDIKDQNPSFGELLVTVRDEKMVSRLKPLVEDYAKKAFPERLVQVVLFANGPSIPYGVECHIRGKDGAVLRGLSARVREIMKEEGGIHITDNWRQKEKVLRPVINESKARQCGITRSDIAKNLQMNYGGQPVGIYREGEDLLPMISRPQRDLRTGYSGVENIQVVSAATGMSVPLIQVVDDPNHCVMEDAIIRRRHQVKTITPQCNPAGGELNSDLLARVKPRVEKEILPNLPPGYTIEWAGEYKQSNKARRPILKMFPICLGLMFLILFCQFNQYRPPIIIFATLPLASIGVVWGLTLSRLPLSFMAIVGFLGLSGMLIKNGIVLIDEIQFNRFSRGMTPYSSVIEAGVSRLRPVSMAAGTTVLGMIPLLWDTFYASMGVTIIGGLVGATVLTLLAVPLGYAILYRIPPEN